MSTLLLIDTVAAPERARLQTLRTQQEIVRGTIAELRGVSMNDDFSSVASAELVEAQNADRVLCGELKIVESEITGRIAEARREADAAFFASLAPMYRDLLKTCERARTERRRIVAAVDEHCARTGSMAVPGVPLVFLETLDDVRTWLRENGSV